MNNTREIGADEVRQATVRAASWLERNALSIDGMPHGVALSELSLVVPLLRTFVLAQRQRDIKDNVLDKEKSITLAANLLDNAVKALDLLVEELQGGVGIPLSPPVPAKTESNGCE